MGEARYHFATGRNRVGHTAEIGHINQKLGAYEVEVFQNQYGDEKAEALYYRIPLQHPVLTRRAPLTQAARLEWASAIHAPLGLESEQMKDALEAGYFTEPVGTKLTLSNWTTPEVVRYAEVLREVAPQGLNHVYFSSSRDELVDKGLRSLRIQRKDAQVIIGLERQYVGHTTAAARSLSDPAGFQQPFSFFDWPLVAHPEEVGTLETIQQIQKLINDHGADNILALTLELVGERSGYVLSDEFLHAANTLRENTGIPLVFVESAGALGRNGETVFVTEQSPVSPNMVLWYTGAQLGQIFVDDHYYVPKPLTLISTWDGDEVCMRRTLCHLQAAHRFIATDRARSFAEGVSKVAGAVKVSGRGFWQVLDFEDANRAETFLRACYDNGLRLGRGLPGRVVVAPPLTVTDGEMKKAFEIMAKAI